MRLVRGVMISGILLLAVGLAQASVNTDWDKKTDFKKFTTYFWKKLPDTGNNLSDQRIIDSIDGQLQAKGWKKAADISEAQAVIAVNTAKEQQQRIDTMYSGWGGWGYYGWYGAPMGATTTVSTYNTGTLLVDIFDASTKQLVWRGTATKTLSENPEKNQKTLDKVTKEMFWAFPPALPKEKQK